MVMQIVNVSTTVVRKGKRVSPPIGKPFDFTQEEVDYLNKVMPGATRKPVNETAAKVEEIESDIDEDEDEAEDDAAADIDEDEEQEEVAAEKPAAKKAAAKKPAAKKAAAKKAAEGEDDDI